MKYRVRICRPDCANITVDAKDKEDATIQVFDQIFYHDRCDVKFDGRRFNLAKGYLLDVMRIDDSGKVVKE